MSQWDAALDHAQVALLGDEPGEAIEPLLESWRRSRAPATAELLEQISILALDPSEIPDPPLDVYSRASFHDWLPMGLHPWIRLPPPDPRAILPLIVSEKNALHTDYKPSLPAPLADALRAHGDPRATGILDQILPGSRGPFAEAIKELQRALPRPVELDTESALQIRRMAAEVARRDPLQRIRAALAAPIVSGRARVLRAFCLPTWLGRSLFLVDAPKIERGVLVGCSLRPRLPSLIEAALGDPAFRSVRELSFSGESFWAREQRPPWWAPSEEPWTGPRTRAAVTRLLHELADCSLRHVHALPPEILVEMAAARRDWPFTRLSIWLSETDPEAHQALRRALAECSFPSLTGLSFIGNTASPDTIEWLWRLPAGTRIRELDLRTPVSGWDRWIASGALPRNILALKLRSRDWDAEIGRDEDQELSRASLELSARWDSYEPIAEDPPTPGADLIDLLRRLPDDGLTSLSADGLGELDEEGREALVREARRQRWLSELILPDEDDAPVEIDLSGGM